MHSVYVTPGVERNEWSKTVWFHPVENTLAAELTDIWVFLPVSEHQLWAGEHSTGVHTELCAACYFILPVYIRKLVGERGGKHSALFLCCFWAATCRAASFFSALWQLLEFWGKNEGKMWTKHLCFLGFFFIGLIATTFISHSTVRQGCNFPIT